MPDVRVERDGQALIATMSGGWEKNQSTERLEADYRLNFETEDAKQGPRAFAEKRKPQLKRR